MAHNRTVLKMTLARKALLLFAALGLTACVPCQTLRQPASGDHALDVLANFSTRVWQTRDGLPQETVQAVAQTADGFLWIGTTGGLLRFDGSRFTSYDRGNTPALKENSIFCLSAAHDGTLWIGTEGGGVVRMRAGQLRRFSAADGLSDGFVRTALEDRQGKLWIGTDDGLFQLPDSFAEHVVRLDNTAAIPAMAVHALAAGSDGSVWAGGSRLVSIRNGVAVNYPLAGQYSETRVKSILQTRDGMIWVGTVSGLQRLRPGRRSFERYAGVRGTVRTLREANDGTLWIGTIGQGAYTIRNGRLAAMGPETSADLKLPSRTILSLFEDAERNVWMGTQAGLVRFSRSAMRVIPLPNTSDSDFETVSRDADNSLWVAGTSLTHLVNGTAYPVKMAALRGARVRNVFRAHDGTLWLGTDGRGIFRINSSGRTEQFTTANGLVNNFIRGILESRHGDLWIATDEGVSRWSRGTFHNFTVADGLSYFSVRTLLEDGRGDLWIGTDRGLSHLAGDHFVQDAATRALAAEKVWTLHQAPGGILWIGTRDDGLYRFAPAANSVAHFTSEQGLASNSVYQILEDGRGRFWMSGANGVAVFPVADLERLAGNANAYVTQRFFAVSTGGELTPLYGGTMPAGTVTADGNVWFPTSKGPVEFLANEAEVATGSKVFLDQVTADGRVSQPQEEAILLPAGNRNLEFTYGSILLGVQHALQFQYKLQGFDPDWRFGSNRRVADYTNLPAGRYTFRVRAFQDGGSPITECSQLVIKKQYFFLTWWFLACCILLLVLVIWWLHRQKIRRVELAFRAVLDERARLAREMHDTLIQGCTGVSLLLEAASAGGDSGDSRDEELLDYARTQLAASIDEARQAIWNLRGQQTAELGQTLKTLAERLDRSSNVAVKCSIMGEPYDFHGTAMHEIGMASREAIYNALLHANPSRIEIHAMFQADEFLVTVDDDGSGFVTTGGAPEGHFGLQGIEERVRGLGGRVDVKSEAGRGTSVAIRVPRTVVSPHTAHMPERQEAKGTK